MYMANSKILPYSGSVAIWCLYIACLLARHILKAATDRRCKQLKTRHIVTEALYGNILRFAHRSLWFCDIAKLGNRKISSVTI